MSLIRQIRRLVVAAAAVAMLGGAASAQTLTIGVRQGPESIDPHFTALGVHAEAMKHIYDTLVWSGDKLQIEPGLAESWRVVDSTTWEFKLRRGVKFHDGSDFTAEDVKFSIERIPGITGANPTTVYVRRVREVRVIDPHTVHIVTDGPAPTLPYDFVRLFIVSHKAAAGLTRETAPQAFNSGRAAIGTGPYRYVSWTPREEMVLERYDAYWGGPQPWQRVVRREIVNDAARVAQLRAGQVDMISRVPAADVPTLEREQRLRVYKQETIYVFNLELDQREQTPQVSAKDGSRLASNPFRDPRVREAMDLAIDRRALAEIAMEGMGTPANQMVTNGIFGFNPAIPEVRPNIERARQLLTEAGFPNGFKFTLSFSVDRLPGDRAIGTTLVQMFARIGLEATANGLPIAPLVNARQRGELSATMAGWGTLTGEAHYTLSSVAHSNAPTLRLGSFNWRGYANPEVDRLIQAASIELDEAKRREQLQQAGALYIQDRVALPLAAVTSAWALRRDRAEMVRLRTDEDTLAMDVKPVGR